MKESTNELIGLAWAYVGIIVLMLLSILYWNYSDAWVVERVVGGALSLR